MLFYVMGTFLNVRSDRNETIAIVRFSKNKLIDPFIENTHFQLFTNVYSLAFCQESRSKEIHKVFGKRNETSISPLSS